MPDWQVSLWVQALPSSQAVPLAFAELAHTPVAGLHTLVAWHWSGTAQITGLPPVQTPAWQESVLVQLSPSLQAGPVNSLHVPLTAAPAVTEQASQEPPLQAVVQQTPSAQKPLWQSPGPMHAAPGGANVGA